jgi:pSer/pThr/pTyr-binding forkhead associated (FHA) protein
MWLLTCDGDLFGHKPIWLRPASGHLLGRTSGRAEGGEIVRYINHKSVSRKHVTIHVGPVRPGDASRLHTRSEIKITDGSKIGTYINGEKICQTSRILDKLEYTIKLGNYEHAFHLKWQPVVFTFTGLSKAVKASSDPLEAHRKKVEHAEIKLITEYVSSQTTHVIGKKRNTPPGLQALLQGRWLLAHSFIDAMAKATASPGRDMNGIDLPSALENDFEGNWPREEEHILPAAGEPNPKPNEYLKPNAQRAELFANFTFIFLSQPQYDVLMPVATSGSGKALLWDVETGTKKAEDLVAYVKEVAGAKGDGDFRLSQHTGKGGIVIIRLEKKDEPWVAAFLTTVESTLEQRAMEQNQFLSAILSNDTSDLRRPLLRESQSQAQLAASLNGNSERVASRTRDRSPPKARPVEPQAPTPANDQTSPATQNNSEPSEMVESTTRKKPRRTVTQSRFKGFGEIDPSQFTRPESESPEPSQNTPQDQSMDVDEPSHKEPSQQPSRKRPAPVDEDDGAEKQRAMIDNILPGAAAMKKRRLNQTKDARGGTQNSTPEPETAAKATKKVPTKKKHKEIDVGARLKEQKEEAEEARRRDEESLREALQDIDIADVRAKVESFALPQREPPPRRAQVETSGPSDQWDPAWNGRKNFKRFKRKGQTDAGPRLPRVIVALEEVPRKGHGIGDEYWLNKSSSKGQGRSQTQTQTQTPIAHDNGDDDPTRFRRRVQNSIRDDQEAEEMSAVFPDDVAGSARTSSSRAGVNSTPSQTLGTESQRRGAGKRSAAQQDGPAPKRAKASRPAPSRVTVEDDDDDGVKFRRKRR